MESKGLTELARRELRARLAYTYIAAGVNSQMYHRSGRDAQSLTDGALFWVGVVSYVTCHRRGRLASPIKTAGGKQYACQVYAQDGDTRRLQREQRKTIVAYQPLSCV